MSARELLAESIEAMDSLWAAIGDRLLAKGPLDNGYANNVCAEIRAVQKKIKAHLASLSEPVAMPVAWQPIETAPKSGPCKEVILFVPTMFGTGGACIAHWAFGDNGEQPAFGPAWFFWTGYHFAELRDKPTHWQPLPKPPERGK